MTKGSFNQKDLSEAHSLSAMTEKVIKILNTKIIKDRRSEHYQIQWHN